MQNCHMTQHFLFQINIKEKQEFEQIPVYTRSQQHYSQKPEDRRNLCPQIDEWRNKMWCVHTMGYYSALKRKEILTHATTWMSLEDIAR